jgi:hypothetical protein
MPDQEQLTAGGTRPWYHALRLRLPRASSLRPNDLRRPAYVRLPDPTASGSRACRRSPVVFDSAFRRPSGPLSVGPWSRRPSSAFWSRRLSVRQPPSALGSVGFPLALRDPFASVAFDSVGFTAGRSDACVWRPSRRYRLRPADRFRDGCPSRRQWVSPTRVCGRVEDERHQPGRRRLGFRQVPVVKLDGPASAGSPGRRAHMASVVLGPPAQG